MCVPLTDASKCPLACLAWIYFISFISLESLLFKKSAQRIFRCRWVTFVVVNRHHPQQWRKSAIYVHIGGVRPQLTSLPRVVNLVCSIPLLGISKMHKKSCQISCPFWNFPQIEACVDCLINLLHVGNIVFLLKRRLSLSSFWFLCYKWWGKAWNAFIIAQKCFMLAKHATSFPAYLLQVKDHYNKPFTTGVIDITSTSEDDSLPTWPSVYKSLILKCCGQFIQNVVSEFDLVPCS